MDNNNFENPVSSDESADFSLDSILAEFEAEKQLFSGAPKAAPPSEPIIINSWDNNIGEAKISSAMDFLESQSAEQDEVAAPELKSVVYENPSRESHYASNPFGEAEADERIADNTYDDAQTADPVPSAQAVSEDELWAQSTDEDEGGEYATASSYQPDDSYPRRERVADFKERVLAPIFGLLAASSMKREQARRIAEARREANPPTQPPELRVDRAAGLYEAQSQSLKLRCLFATFLSAILVYLSFNLPALGALGNSPTLRILMCLVLELVVMLIGLDIFTNGLSSIIAGKPGAESLIVFSAIISAADALVIALTGNSAIGLPYCAVSALSMTFALWGSKLSCSGFATSFKTAALAKDPSVVLSEPGVDAEGCVLAKVKRPVTGFVRTAEAADIFETSYKLFAPIIMIATIVLSLLCFFASEKCNNLLHTLSATTSIAASFSAIFGFALPFFVLANRLAKSGVAIAGYSGAAELGRIRRVLISDSDVFPARTLSIADIAISEGSNPGTVIAYTGSMIAASGMGIAPIFTELMRKNGCSMQKVEDFACHEGGGIVATVGGQKVYVGSHNFMRLMGVRLPKNVSSKNAVYSAINESLAGVFPINYTPVSSVQRAIVTLLRSKTEPLFAVRDFNITPLLIKQKFRLPSGSYDFPSFADRYRISSPEAEDGGTVVAMFARGGLNAVAGLTSRGRTLYNGLRLCAALSILGSVIGMLLVLSLCWSGAFSSASCGNILTFMLLWQVPLLMITLGLRR